MPENTEANLADKCTLPTLELSEPAEWDEFRRALGTGEKSLKVVYRDLVVEFHNVGADPSDLVQFLRNGGVLSDNVEHLKARLNRSNGSMNPFNRWKWNMDYPDCLDYLSPDGAVLSTTRDIDTSEHLFDQVFHFGKKSWVGKNDLLTILRLYEERYIKKSAR